MFALPVKQEVETYNSRHLDGTLMYPGRWICTYVLMWNSVWVLVAREQA
jgi:hypothetical protein